MSEALNTDELFTIREAAEVLKCTSRHVRNLISAGKIQVIALGSGPKGDRIAQSDIDEFINSCRRYRGSECQSTSEETHGGSKSTAMDALLDGPLKPPARGRRKRLKGSSVSKITPATESPT